MPFVITIDGPAGSGKSTAARKLAGRLEMPYLDTGAMYRAVALATLHAGVNRFDEQSLEPVLDRLDLVLDCVPTYARVMLAGHDVSERIRQPDVTETSNLIAQVPLVRQRLVQMQRQIARDKGRLVSEGRDQGATVFPDAACKFVLEASAEKRAERRFYEMAAEGIDGSMDWVLANIRQRDARDRHRWDALAKDPRVIVIDTTHMALSELLDLMVARVTPRLLERSDRDLFSEQ